MDKRESDEIEHLRGELQAIRGFGVRAIAALLTVGATVGFGAIFTAGDYKRQVDVLVEDVRELRQEVRQLRVAVSTAQRRKRKENDL